MHPLNDAIAALLREVAARVVMPRFRHLAADQIEEKSPGDLVTIADRESEVMIAAGLLALMPDGRIVGEEAYAADPALLDGLDTGRVWLVDPIDGTGNFAAGRSPFGLMVALVESGATRAGWMLDPVTDRLCHALAGGGAFVDGERVLARATGREPPVAALASTYMTPDERADVERRTAGLLTPVDIPRCAAEQYPRLVLGENDVALFKATFPWDHAAGALFVTEAGGRVARLDGTPYRVADRRTGMLGASTPALWDRVARMLHT